MTKMATMPIYGRNMNNSSSLEPKGFSSTTRSNFVKCVQMMPHAGLILTYLKTNFMRSFLGIGERKLVQMI